MEALKNSVLIKVSIELSICEVEVTDELFDRNR